MESKSQLSKIESITIIAITNRINTLEMCNTIYKIEKGELYKTYA